MRNITVLLSSIVIISGCSIKSHKLSSYDLQTEVNVHMQKRYPNSVLMVKYPSSLGAFGGSRIYYKRDGLTSYYLYSQWSQSLNRIIYNQLLKELESSNLFKAVVGFNSGVKANMELETEILKFYHIVTDSGSYSNIEIVVKLIDANSKSVIKVKRFSYKDTIKEANAKEFVKKSEEALRRFIKELIATL